MREAGWPICCGQSQPDEIKGHVRRLSWRQTQLSAWTQALNG